MKVIRGISRVSAAYRRPVLAIGVFDGVHRGHQHVIGKVVRKAHAIGGTAIVMTFDPHPVHVLRPDVYIPLIVSLPYRLKLLEKLDVDVCIVLSFTHRFSELPPQDFIRRYLLRKIRPVSVVIGDDFRFGCNRTAGLIEFKNYGKQNGFEVTAIRVGHDGRKNISSTRIRQLISDGKLNIVKKLLGRPVSILGTVIHGDARGKTLGYPTANIMPAQEVIPPSGVYLVYVEVKNKRYCGIANVGRRPSFKRIGKVNIEVHVFHFRKNLYGQDIIVEFLKKIRDEKLFLSQDTLVQQLRKDEKRAKKWFAEHAGSPSPE